MRLALPVFKNGWRHSMDFIRKHIIKVIIKLLLLIGKYLRFILAGASGGKGSTGEGSSRGATIRTVVELRKNQEVFILVGQEGNSACVKVSLLVYLIL